MSISRCHIWFIGDNFMSSSIVQYLIRADEKWNYTKRNFDIQYVLTSKVNQGHNPFPLSRVTNAFAHALNSFNRLPRMIVFILEADIINQIKLNDFGLSKLYTLLIQWLMAEIKRLLSTYKQYLPDKAKTPNQPHLLWIAPTQHKNYDSNSNVHRRKFIAGMEAVGRLHENTSVLRLIQCWNYNDDALYDGRTGRITTEGLSRFWMAVDKTVRFCDVKIQPEHLLEENSGCRFKVDHRQKNNRYALPRPPKI